VDTFIVVGDCTDICVYQLAMHLLTWANARDLEWRVIVPEDCVQTYDLPLETANQVGAKPHPGDLLHQVFLYHMALNGIEIVRSVK
jgi:nicotinamidase-related amidase